MVRLSLLNKNAYVFTFKSARLLNSGALTARGGAEMFGAQPAETASGESKKISGKDSEKAWAEFLEKYPGVCGGCGGFKTAISRQCRACAIAARKPSETKVETVCGHCGVVFTPKWSTTFKRRRRFCSPRCANTANAPRLTDTKDRLRKRRSKRSRWRNCRAMSGRKAVGRWRLIAERDGWVCWVCNAAIDSTLKFPDRWSGTVDHVIPLAEGGTDEDWNCKAAHFTCNARRGSLTKLGQPHGIRELRQASATDRFEDVTGQSQ